MKKVTLCLAAALLTFTLGTVIAITPRVVTAYRAQALCSREAVLRAELSRMRQAIRRYESEKGQPPRSLAQLVETGYLKEIPVDPLTGQRDWYEDIDIAGYIGWVMLQDVHSLSPAVSSEGTPYRGW